MHVRKIFCLMLMCWARFIIVPAYGLDAPSIMGGPELPSELKRLITDVLRPSFQSAGYFPGLLQRSEFIEKIIPGEHFRGEDVLLHTDKMLKGLNGPDRQENLKVLEAICKFYIEFFKEYIHRKSFGGFLTPKTESSEKSRALILQNVHTCYMFSEYAKKKVAKIELITKPDIQGVDEADSFLEQYPLRLRLTRLIVNIFMLNREEKGIALQEDIYRRRKKLYALLEGFQDEVSEILTSFLQRGVVQAKTVLQGLPEFMILLQEHALNISLWNMLVRLGQEQTKKILLTTISIFGVGAALVFTWKKVMPQTTIEKLADKTLAEWPNLQKDVKDVQDLLILLKKDTPVVFNAVANLANAITEKVKKAPSSTPENLTKAAVQEAVREVVKVLATDEIIKSSDERSAFIKKIEQFIIEFFKGTAEMDAVIKHALKQLDDKAVDYNLIDVALTEIRRLLNTNVVLNVLQSSPKILPALYAAYWNKDLPNVQKHLKQIEAMLQGPGGLSQENLICYQEQIAKIQQSAARIKGKS